MPVAEVTLPGQASSVPTARHFVESLLTAWGRPDLGWTAALCVSELAGNAALHARTTFTVSVGCDGPESDVRVTVTDGSQRVPAIRDYGTHATTGRGLRMVDELATSWGVDVGAQGKSVWLVLRQRTAERPAVEDTELDVDVLLAGFDDEEPLQPGEPWPPAGRASGLSGVTVTHLRTAFRFALLAA